MQRLIVVLALSTAPLAGCIVSADSTTSMTGRYVGGQTLEQIQPGKSQEYVLALIGEPTTRTSLSTGGAVWKWEYSEKTTRRGSVIFIANDKSHKETRGAAYVEFDDAGAVVNAWRD